MFPHIFVTPVTIARGAPHWARPSLLAGRDGQETTTRIGARLSGAVAVEVNAAGLSSAQMQELEDAWRNAQPMKVECGLCGWGAKGMTGEVLVKQKEHFLGHGISKRRSRRHIRSLTRFRQHDLTDDDVVEIYEERRARALLTGVEIED